MSPNTSHQPSNFYSGGHLDRADRLRQDAGWLKRQIEDPETLLVPLWRSQNLVAGSAPKPAFMMQALEGDARALWLRVADGGGLIEAAQEVVFLGRREERAYFALDLSGLARERADALAGKVGAFRDLREIGPLLKDWEGAVLAYARGVMHWHHRHRFCGLCGSPTESISAGHVRKCSKSDCATSHFPRTDPAVIMLVHDGAKRCLLARQEVWPPGMHSTLAGFVEPGESLEDAVAREVEEEVGLEIEQITYHSSQPWPFPSSLMLGFYAKSRGQRLAVNRDEIEAARWFSRDELIASPEDESLRLPRRDSIARRLINEWLAETG